MRFDLPRAADLEELRRKLQEIEESLHVDITLSPA